MANTITEPDTRTEAPEGIPQFGTLIHRHRTRLGLTQRELADLSTISVRAIRDLEQGRAKRPRNDTIRLICDGLRLGPRARAALEAAAHQGRGGWALRGGDQADPPAPPAPLQPILGRDTEVAALTGELAGGAERLVNVVGLSGAGKTRLALEVAARSHAERGLPVLWFAFPGAPADYRPGLTPDALDAAVRGGVEALFPARAPEGTAPQEGDEGARSGLTSLTELVADQPALLVVDGITTQEPRPDLLSRLLQDCPGLRLLATAEQPWCVPGERPFLLTPLETPGAEDELETAASLPAVRLFVDQVRRVRPDFVLTAANHGAVAGICRQLDGLPLMLRAAASWLLVYDLDTLGHLLATDPAFPLDHLTDAEDGTRFRAALTRRTRGLAPGHRELLTALCAREGEFGLDDVVALTGRPLPDCGRVVRDLLLSGLIRPSYEPGRSRFRVLNLLRASHIAG